MEITTTVATTEAATVVHTYETVEADGTIVVHIVGEEVVKLKSATFRVTAVSEYDGLARENNIRNGWDGRIYVLECKKGAPRVGHRNGDHWATWKV